MEHKVWQCKAGRHGAKQHEAASEWVNNMMAGPTLPSAKMRGDRVARFNLLAAAALMMCTSMMLVLFQFYALQRRARAQPASPCGHAGHAGGRGTCAGNDRLAAEQLLAPLAGAPAIEQALVYTPYGLPFARFARSGSDIAPAAPLHGMHFAWRDGHATLLAGCPAAAPCCCAPAWRRCTAA